MDVGYVCLLCLLVFGDAILSLFYLTVCDWCFLWFVLLGVYGVTLLGFVVSLFTGVFCVVGVRFYLCVLSALV